MQSLHTTPPRLTPCSSAPRPMHGMSRGRTGRRPLTALAVKVGDKAPDFSLPDQNGKNIKLSSYQGLFGKPSDDSPGCTKQANAFKDGYGDIKKAGAEVIGVSSQSVDSHIKFRSKLDLPFSLLADEGGKVRSQYGVKKDLLGLLDGRETYVIDKNGTVKTVFNNQFQPEKHLQEALAALT